MVKAIILAIGMVVGFSFPPAILIACLLTILVWAIPLRKPLDWLGQRE